MIGRNDRVIVDALEALAHAMGQQNQQADGCDHGLYRFPRNKPQTFKGKHDTGVLRLGCMIRGLGCYMKHLFDQKELNMRQRR